MVKTIAVAGKGGTGKTMIAGLLLRYIRDNNLGVALAIDADPSSNLHSVLGMSAPGSIGDLREETLNKVIQDELAPGMPLRDYLDFRLEDILVEGPGIDLLTMGRPEGPGCYCAANHLLRLLIDRLSGNYDYVIIDNEAGLEHLSRRTTRDMDVMLVVSDSTVRGLESAARVVQLTEEIKNNIGNSYLVLNRVDRDLPPPLQSAIDRVGLKTAAIISQDPLVVEYDALGRPLVELPDNSNVYRAIEEIAKTIGLVSR